MDNLFYLPSANNYLFFGFQVYVKSLEEMSKNKQKIVQKKLKQQIFLYSEMQVILVSQNEAMVQEKIQIYQQLILMGIKVESAIWLIEGALRVPAHSEYEIVFEKCEEKKGAIGAGADSLEFRKWNRSCRESDKEY